MSENQRFTKNTSVLKASVFSVLSLFFAMQLGAASQEGHEKHNEAQHEMTPSTESTEHSTESHESDGFNPGTMIIEHVSDAHDWHLWGEGDHAVSIPLPVIIYTESKGFTVFSSSKFHHGHASYEGFKLNHEGQIVWEEESNEEALYDVSITKNVAAMFIGAILLILMVTSMAKHYTKNQGKAPKGFYNLIEPLVVFLRDDVIKPNIGPRADRFMPFLLSIFFFIFILNLTGQIPFFPGGANVTGNIAVTMVLALFVFVTVTFSGNKYYWKHIFMPDVPVWMYIIIIPIEVLGVVLKPFVLMLRLFANITAGHIIILGFFSLIFIFGAMSPTLGYAVSPLSVAFTVFMSLLELLVAFLQAFVFTLLSAIYIGMAVEEHH
jgi:F-type H+-transporting ATPase subunit a